MWWAYISFCLSGCSLWLSVSVSLLVLAVEWSFPDIFQSIYSIVSSLSWLNWLTWFNLDLWNANREKLAPLLLIVQDPSDEPSSLFLWQTLAFPSFFSEDLTIFLLWCPWDLNRWISPGKSSGSSYNRRTSYSSFHLYALMPIQQLFSTTVILYI